MAVLSIYSIYPIIVSAIAISFWLIERLMFYHVSITAFKIRMERMEDEDDDNDGMLDDYDSSQ